MAAIATPSSVARDRYQRCFASSIFDPPVSPKSHAAPAGKRRDQTVHELFGDDQEGKNLKFQQGTFLPKGDVRSAREKKQDFLSSTVLPTTAYDYNPDEEEAGYEQQTESPREFSTDPVARRLQENTSLIFADGQHPHHAAVDPDSHSRWAENKLRPTSFRWYQYPSDVKDEGEHSAAERSLHEKRSTVFRDVANGEESEAQAVHARQAEERQERAVEHESDEKRRANCYYSDLFGRETPMDYAAPQSARHAKFKPSPEDRITVHGDWSDSRTEIERGAKGINSRTPADRKLEEFHHANVFDAREAAAQRNFKPEPIMHHCQAPDVMDNSEKIIRHDNDTKVIHQAHMQSSVVDQDFYDQAASRTAWEVAEVHISGLHPEEGNDSIAKKVKGAGFHVIRVNAAMDPVNNTCKGTCRLQVRYNPDARQHPVETLLRSLEEKHGLRGEM